MLPTCCLAAAERPNIVHIMGDDVGRDNLGFFNGGATHTPHLDATFFRGGVFLADFHTFKICGPSRASTMTGRYPFNAGFYGDGAAQHIANFSTYPGLLRDRAGYATHAIGKWDVGFVAKETTATYKGFSSWLGYYKACNTDLFYHSTDCTLSDGARGGDDSTTVPGTDFSYNSRASHTNTIGPAGGYNGTYSTRIFAAHARKIIAEHNFQQAPLYLYVAPQNVHLACGSKASKLVQGIQAPCQTVSLYDSTVFNDTYKAQSAVTTELDYLVGNITTALQAQEVFNNTLMIFTSDNGGPLDREFCGPIVFCLLLLLFF